MCLSPDNEHTCSETDFIEEKGNFHQLLEFSIPLARPTDDQGWGGWPPPSLVVSLTVKYPFFTPSLSPWSNWNTQIIDCSGFIATNLTPAPPPIPGVALRKPLESRQRHLDSPGECWLAEEGLFYRARRWCSGIMQDSHSCDPGSIPGRRKFWNFERKGKFCEGQKKSPWRGIEPRPPAWQAGILTTRLSRIGYYGPVEKHWSFPQKTVCSKNKWES